MLQPRDAPAPRNHSKEPANWPIHKLFHCSLVIQNFNYKFASDSQHHQKTIQYSIFENPATHTLDTTGAVSSCLVLAKAKHPASSNISAGRTHKIFQKKMLLLMEEILHQLRLVVYPIIFMVLYIPGGCLGFLPSTVSLGTALSSHVECWSHNKTASCYTISMGDQDQIGTSQLACLARS